MNYDYEQDRAEYLLEQVDESIRLAEKELAEKRAHICDPTKLYCADCSWLRAVERKDPK